MFSEMHHVANLTSLWMFRKEKNKCFQLSSNHIKTLCNTKHIKKKMSLSMVSLHRHYCLSIPLLFEPFQAQVFLDHDFFLFSFCAARVMLNF